MWDPLTQPPKMTSQSLKYVVTIPQPKHALREPHRNLEIFLLSCWLQVSMLHAATLIHQSLLWLPNGTAATGMIETWNVPEKKFVHLFSVSVSFGPGQIDPPTTSSTKNMYLAEKSCTKIVWVSKWHPCPFDEIANHFSTAKHYIQWLQFRVKLLSNSRMEFHFSTLGGWRFKRWTWRTCRKGIATPIEHVPFATCVYYVYSTLLFLHSR